MNQEKKDVLIIGSGGREHALVWKLKQSSKVRDIFVAPGNAGTSKIAVNVPLSKTGEILNWIKNNPIDLVVIGPDSYLAEGLTDKIQKLGIPVFGPTKRAAEIEWSKAFAKQFMKEENIPTANYKIFTDIKKAVSYIKNKPFPLVIKASGLALGKGVIIANSHKEAELALQKIMDKKIFGEAGKEVVIEEYLDGKEISVHAFCDGRNAVMFPPAQDHKRIFDNDKGPNTGGMGAIAPVPGVTSRQMKEIKEKIVVPTLRALKKRKRVFSGVLFPGIMITKDGPKVIEFNARLGDPETQVFMRLLETDLVDILFACLDKKLNKQKIKWSKGAACCVVCVSEGYPGNYKKGKVVKGLDNIKNKKVEIFQAGTKNKKGKTVTNGGRVLGVTSAAHNLKKALAESYQAIRGLYFKGMRYRKDIGTKLM